MHALICAAAGLTVSFSVAGVAEAARGAEPARDTTLETLQFEVMQGLTGANSARFWSANTRDIIAGETYGAAITAFSSAGGAYLDDVPDIGTFGGGFSDAGVNVVTGAQMLHAQSQVGNQVFVSIFTTDSSDIVPAGLTLGGAVVDTLFLEVGWNNAPADPIFYPGFLASHVDSVTLQLYSNGGLIFAGAVAPGNSDFSSGLASVGGVSATGGIGGNDIDEIQLVWNLNVPTPGAASVFGLAGLAAVRRRRR